MLGLGQLVFTLDDATHCNCVNVISSTIGPACDQPHEECVRFFPTLMPKGFLTFFHQTQFDDTQRDTAYAFRAPSNGEVP